MARGKARLLQLRGERRFAHVAAVGQAQQDIRQQTGHDALPNDDLQRFQEIIITAQNFFACGVAVRSFVPSRRAGRKERGREGKGISKKEGRK